MKLSLRWSAWLALFLMLGTVAAESIHHHPRQTESASCSICVVAHSTAPTATPNHARPVFEVIGLLQNEKVTAHARHRASDLGIRGPPTA